MADITQEQMDQIMKMDFEKVAKATLAMLIEINENIKEVKDSIDRSNKDLSFHYDRKFPDGA